jgi:F420-dependent oxidoreductase-like protein
MKLRIFTEPQQGASYDDLLQVARATQDLGFDAFFRSDHYLKMGDGDGMPGPSDAWTTLAGLARDTERIRLGTMVSSATFRLPGPLAITVAGVDQMSGGRVELGLGTGWFADEHAAYGIPFADVPERFDRFAEQVEIIDGLWRTPVGETFSFTGKHYQLTDSPALAKPAQAPRPPIILGGAAKKRSAALAARFADEYNIGFSSVADTAAAVGRIQAAVAQTGRAAESMIYSAAHAICAGADEATVTARAAAIGRDVTELRDNALAGCGAEIVDRIGQYAATGVSTMYLQVLDLADLDHLAYIAEQIAPQL